MGVEMMRPSATARVRGLEAMEMERCVRCGLAPRWMMTSLRAWVIGGGGAGDGERVFCVGEDGITETLSLLRRRTRAVRWVPRDFPRIEDQPTFSALEGERAGSAFSSNEAVDVGGDSPRMGPRSPRLAPDM